jgi:hypothetical protein
MTARKITFVEDEPSIRPITLNRKNALFPGPEGGAEHWAIIASLIETCRLNKVDPLTYLTDVLSRIVNGNPRSEISCFRGPTTSRPQSCGLRTTLTGIPRTETVLDVVREPLRSIRPGRRQHLHARNHITTI